MKTQAAKKDVLPGERPRWLMPVLTAALFFFYALLYDAGLSESVTAKIMTMCLLFLLAGVLFFWKGAAARLSPKLSLPFFAVTGYVLVCGVSTLYASSGKFAIQEYVVMLSSFVAFMLLLLMAKPGDSSVRAVAGAVAGALAVYSLISIDAASVGWSTAAFKLLISPFTPIFTYYGGFEEGMRITSIFQAPNTYAGSTALAIFLNLYLVQSEKVLWKRRVYLAMLAVSALGFLLAFSMGGTAMFALSVAVYLIAAGKGKRIPAFILMLETAVPTVLMAAVSYIGLGQQGARALVPVAAMAANAGLLILADWLLGDKLIAFLQNRGKLSAVCLGILAGLLLLYVGLGFVLTGSYTFEPGESLGRSAYPEPGEYALSLETDAPLAVTVESQNDAQTQLHQSTVLYSGAAEGASFTVPEGAKVVHVTFIAPEGGKLSRAVIQGEKTYALSLKYLLFPEFVANRLQGLFANENAIQRFVFFRDGMRVFARSPIIGSGVGSFEGALYGVQDFYYATKYVHNHYIQALADTGIIGCAFFVGSLVLLAVCLFKHRRTEEAFFPALAACLAMVAGHSVVEVSFSTEVFQPTAFLIFGLIIVNFSEPVRKKGKKDVSPALEQGIRFGSGAFACLFALLLGGNLFAKVIVQTGRSFSALETAAAIDVYENNDYKLTYVVESTKYPENTALREKAAHYAKELRKVRSNSVAQELADYYIQMGRYDDVFNCIEEAVPYMRSYSDAWQDNFVNLEFAFSKLYNPTYDKLMKEREKYLARALDIVDILTEVNRAQMDEITLLPRNNMLIGNLIAASGLSGQEETDALLQNRLFGLDGFADINEDGIPDALTSQNGTLTGENGVLHIAGGDVLFLSTFHDLEGDYRIFLDCRPEAVAAVTVNGQPVAFQAEGNGTSAVTHLPENVEVANLTVAVSFQSDAEITDFTVGRAGA